MRAQVLVALVDAVGILIGALALQLPIPLALFALTFVTAFVPVVGAVLAGTVACALALVTHGPVSALIMLGITVAVMETEGHFLQPILLGRAVSLHPLAVLIGLAVGATLAGIVGALLVIPVLAFGVAFIRGLDPSRFDGELQAELRE
jgi:predicted PurR-regulated permease PerM